MIRHDQAGWRDLVLMEIARTECLLADLRRLSFRQYPNPDDMAVGTQIWDAEPVLRREPCLIALARLPVGKKSLAPRQMTITVRTLLVGDFGQSWVRNAFGLYRLGWE